MIEAMRFGRIEVAYFGPFSYVLAKSKASGIEPFAVGVERGSPTYQSVLIATAGGPVKTLEDVRGKPFGFDDQDRKSTRLNSSHSQISYAVFCLKKKKKHAS